MGAERLRSRPAVVAASVGLWSALAAFAGGCGSSASTPASATALAEKKPSHFQIVRAIGPAERIAVANRLRDRNGTSWLVGGEERGLGPADIDTYRGFIRRASRRDRQGAPVSVDPSEASSRALTFVQRNADLLGVPASQIVLLDARAAKLDADNPFGGDLLWAVNVERRFASKGLEGFEELVNVVEIVVFVGADGSIRAFANVSKVHPPLLIDPRPLLRANDPRVVAQVVGRRVFAVVDDPTKPATPVRELRRVPLGVVENTDVTRVDLVIHASEGPLGAWMTYRLAYQVEVAKGRPGDIFFRWIVDSDTGAVIEDARPPILAAWP